MSHILRPDLEFSKKYDVGHAKQYFEKHQDGFWRRLSNWRDQQIARKALRIAGNPKSVLDVPCGTGRFWDVLAEDPQRIIHASDYNQAMIATGMAHRPQELTGRIKTFQASAFNLPVPDNFVESIFCIRLVHHLGNPEDRMTLFREFHRAASSSVIVSLWVDGNIKSIARKAKEEKREDRPYQNRFVIPAATIEREFAESGFEIVERLDFLKYYHMWRTYVLRKVPAPRVTAL